MAENFTEDALDSLFRKARWHEDGEFVSMNPHGVDGNPYASGPSQTIYVATFTDPKTAAAVRDRMNALLQAQEAPEESRAFIISEANLNTVNIGEEGLQALGIDPKQAISM